MLSGPAYTMAPKQSVQDVATAKLPGPGQYHAAPTEAGAAFSFVRAPRHTTEAAAEAPAPGAYDVASARGGPAWSMPTAGRRLHDEESDHIPGPGDYGVQV